MLQYKIKKPLSKIAKRRNPRYHSYWLKFATLMSPTICFRYHFKQFGCSKFLRSCRQRDVFAVDSDNSVAQNSLRSWFILSSVRFFVLKKPLGLKIQEANISALPLLLIKFVSLISPTNCFRYHFKQFGCSKFTSFM